MANDRLFVVQYSEETKELTLSDFDDVNYFESEILNCVNCSNNSLIKTKSLIVNDSLNQITKPYNYEFLNPFNVPAPSQYNGLLYNGFALKHANFCPAGFHLLTSAEYISFYFFLSSDPNSKSHFIKKADLNRWPNEVLFPFITDIYDLSILPSGYRDPFSGNFFDYNYKSFIYYDSNHLDQVQAFSLTDYDDAIYADQYFVLNAGYSCRLIKDINDGSSSYTDLDGNIYPLINVNGNLWLGENYKCTKLGNGTPILNITDNSSWINTSLPGYCIYNNDPALL